MVTSILCQCPGECPHCSLVSQSEASTEAMDQSEASINNNIKISLQQSPASQLSQCCV